jgi:hypothetical protein
MATSRKGVSLNPVTNIMDFKTFAKNPVIGTLFLVLIAISYLYVDVRSTFRDQAASQNIRVEKLERKNDIMIESIRLCDSSLSATTSRLRTLSELGKIK